MRKILWLHSHFNYWMGGTKLIYEIIRRIHQHIPVTVFVEDYSPYAKEQYDKAGVELVKTIGITSTSSWYWLNLPFYIRQNQKFLKPFVDPESILISSMFPMNVVWSGFDQTAHQYIFEPFAFIHDDVMMNGFPFAKRMFCHYVAWRYRNLDIRTTQKARVIFTLNDVMKKSIHSVYGKEAVPTYTGIDCNFFMPYDSPDLRLKYKGKRILIHSTDFTPIKGTPLAIRALSDVVKKYPDTLLLITSTIDDRRGLQELMKFAARLGCAGNIQYLGFLPHEELPRYYAFAEVMLHTGLGERSAASSFTLPVKEAMACGTPAIRHPITSEDVEHGISGLAIDPTNTKEYAEGIMQLLGDPEQTKKMGEKAREKIMSRYAWDSVIKTILSHIE